MLQYYNKWEQEIMDRPYSLGKTHQNVRKDRTGIVCKERLANGSKVMVQGTEDHPLSN